MIELYKNRAWVKVFRRFQVDSETSRMIWCLQTNDNEICVLVPCEPSRCFLMMIYDFRCTWSWAWQYEVNVLTVLAMRCGAGHFENEFGDSSDYECCETRSMYVSLGYHLPNTHVASHNACIICNYSRISSDFWDNLRWETMRSFTGFVLVSIRTHSMVGWCSMCKGDMYCCLHHSFIHIGDPKSFEECTKITSALVRHHKIRKVHMSRAIWWRRKTTPTSAIKIVG